MVEQILTTNIITKKQKLNHPLYYYKTIKYHEEIFGDNTPVNIFQLMYVMGTEPTYSPIPFSSKFIDYVSISKMGIKKLAFASMKDRNHYPWDALVLSIEKNGIQKPLLVHELNPRLSYRVIEGKHRFKAISMLSIDAKIPCLLVKFDEDYIVYMIGKQHPNPLASIGYKKYEDGR